MSPTTRTGTDHDGAGDRDAGVVDLRGCTILATGGLGTLASAFALAAAAAGARVALADLVPDDGSSGAARTMDRAREIAARFEARGLEPPAFFHCDITDAGECTALMEAVGDRDVNARGGIDVVVNFAGIHHAPFDLAQDDPAESVRTFDRVIGVNLRGAFLVTSAAARVMVSRRSGHIIHLCSNGSRASLYGSYAYNASKHGVEGIVKTAAAQLAPFGVRVNGIAPGTVITELNRALSFDEAGNPKPRAKSILAHTPTKRFATADGVAETLLAMCVPQRHMTGNVVFCDDGYNIEGHSWPEGNEALYAGSEEVDRLYAAIDERYPRRRNNDER